MTIMAFCYGSSLLIRFTYILPVHGGGKYLFGGTYIILYYLGIVAAHIKIFNRTPKQRMYILIVSTLGWISWWLLNVYDKLPFDKWVEPYYGSGFNPPSIEFMVFAIITLFMLYSFFSLLEERARTFPQRIVGIFTFLGRDTLYIFMYHLLVRDVILNYFPFVHMNKWVLRICVFIPMLVLPVLAVCLLRKLRSLLKLY